MNPHAHTAQSIPCVACAVLTVSDTRSHETDVGGALIRELLAQSGHAVFESAVVRDETEAIAAHVRRWCTGPACRTVLITGGTGLAPRDTTFEALTPLFERTLDGFGELFRALSFQEIGPAAMLSRAIAGVSCRTAIFAMPGSPGGVRLAMDRLVLPTLGHLAWILDKT